MVTLTFDTLKFTERLKAAGVPQAQAIAEAEALRDVLSEALDTSVATKLDIADVRSDLLKLEATVNSNCDRVDGRFGLMEARFDEVGWMMGILVALNVANFARQFF